MSTETSKVKVVAKVKLVKFADGADPTTDAPYSIIEKELTPEQTKQLMEGKEVEGLCR